MLLGGTNPTASAAAAACGPETALKTQSSVVDRSGGAVDRQNTAAEQKAAAPGEIVNKEGNRINVGDRCSVLDKGSGTIMFLGETKFKPGTWAGVELDEPVGKNDGTINGVKYFKCREMHGIFAYAHALSGEVKEKACDAAAETIPKNSNGQEEQGDAVNRLASTSSMGEENEDIVCEDGIDFCLLDPEGNEIDNLEDLVGVMQKTINDNKALQEQLKKTSETAQALQAELAKLKQDMAKDKSATTWGQQRAAASTSKTPRKIVTLIGPPGSGKGTVSSHLKEALGLPQLATGDLLRAAVASGSEVGRQAQDVMGRGDLVSDDIVIDIVRERIQREDCQSGFILDGFPRTVAQDDRLTGLLAETNDNLSNAVVLEVPDEALQARVCGRWLHPSSGRSYHSRFKPPRSLPEGAKPTDANMRDDITDETLEQRPDDTEEALKRRLTKYHTNTKPIVAHYQAKGLVQSVDASRSPGEVCQDVLTLVGAGECPVGHKEDVVVAKAETAPAPAPASAPAPATAAATAAASSPQLVPAPWPTSTASVCSQQVIANPHVLMTNFMLF